MKAYVTLLATDNFIQGTLTLWQSLIDVKSEYPQVVLVNNNLSMKTLTELKNRNITMYNFPFLSYHEDNIQEMKKSWTANQINTANKLNIFRLTQYEKIVYLDSDMLIVKNIDWLFDWPHGSAVMDQGPIYDKQSNVLHLPLPRDYYMNLNSGLLVIEPSLNEFDKAMKILDISHGYDQEIIRELWPNWINEEEKHLPITTSVFAFYLSCYLVLNLVNISDIFIFHFVGEKPFMKSEIDLFSSLGLLEKLYLEIMNRAVNACKDKESSDNAITLGAIPSTGFSYPTFKKIINRYIRNNFSKNSSALDVGFGQGIYGQLLRDYLIIDGVDIYPLHDNNWTRLLYHDIVIKDIRDYEYKYYDLIIMGDVIEHLAINDAQKVIAYAKDHCSMLIVAIPYELEQEANANVNELHVQPDLTHEIFNERYPGFMLFCNDKLHGYYIWKKI